MDNQAAVAFDLEELPDLAAIDRARSGIQQALTASGSALARTDWGMMSGHVADALRDELGTLDLVPWLGWAWSSARELKKLGEETARSGEQRSLPLGSHEIPFDLHPVVTVKVAEVPLPELRFTLRVAAKVNSAILIISQGWLTSLEALDFAFSATLLYGEQVVAGPVKKTYQPGIKPYTFAGAGIQLALPPADQAPESQGS